MAWKTSEVSSYILAQLGYPRRKVELNPSNISEALKRAVRKYGSIKPVIKRDVVSVLSGVQAYNLEALGKPYGKGILTVHPEPVTSPSAVFSEFEYYRMRQPPYVDMGEMVLDQMYYNEIGLVTGTDFDWEWIQDQTMLLIKPSPTRSHGLAYEYNSSPSTIETVPLTDQGWVVDYTLALVKEMLGRIRGKFKGVPGNELPVDTDADELLSEGREERTELVEALNGKRGDWTPPIKG